MIKNMEMEKTLPGFQIYAWSDANKTTPKTSAPALADVMELFRLMQRLEGKLSAFLFQQVCPLLEM